MALACVCVIALHVTPAFAAELTWSAPSECGQPQRLRAQVEQLLHAPLSAARGLDFDVKISAASGGGYQLQLRTRSQASGVLRTRALSGASCQEVTAAAAVAIALAVTGRDADPTTLRPSPAPQAPQSQAAGEPGPKAAVSPRVAAVLAAGAALDGGLLPAPAPGFALDVGLELSALRALVSFALFPTQRTRLDGGAGADFALAAGALLLCVQRPWQPLRLLGCAGFELGRLAASGVGVSNRHDRNRLISGPRLELGLQWQLAQSLGIFARGGGMLPLQRDEFVLSNEQVHKPSALSLRLGLGLEFTL